MNLEFRKSLRRKRTSAASPPTVERDVNAEINLKGWLYRLEGSPLKHWKKRWCVLSQYALFVYRDETEHKLVASLLLPGYSVRVCVSQDCVSHKNAFVAKHEVLKSYYFAADSNAAMCQWRNSMAQTATIQVPSQERNQTGQPSPQPIYDSNNRRYMDMRALTCVTRSPIYANAPPKPKRVSPPKNRPHSADFLSYPEERCIENYPCYAHNNQAKPQTSGNFFDEATATDYSENYQRSATKHNAVPTATILRPKSCLAVPVSPSAEAFTAHYRINSSAYLQVAHEPNIYPVNLLPSMHADSPHEPHQLADNHPGPSNRCLHSTTLGLIEVNPSQRSPSTSTSSSPLPLVTNQSDTLFRPRDSVKARSLHNMPNAQNHLECYGLCKSETSCANNALETGLNSESRNELTSGHNLGLSSQQNTKLSPHSEKQNHPTLTFDSVPFLPIPNKNSSYNSKKSSIGRTNSYNSINRADEIQPSKVEVYRQVPRPSYSTKATSELLAFSALNQQLNGKPNGHGILTLKSPSTGELPSLQSLTDSLYSIAPPESSLPSLENASSDFHTTSPVQHFSNLPPPQLRQNVHHHKTSGHRAGPPKYSEACLRSGYVGPGCVAASKQAECFKTPHPTFSSVVDAAKAEPLTLSQWEQYTTKPPPVLSSSKLLSERTNYSNTKFPLENSRLDRYNYGREDLFKASQLFYTSRVIEETPILTVNRRTPTTLDVSFQSSSHNSVFEHDLSTDHHEPGDAHQPRPTLAQIDSANYAILKYEIEGSRVCSEGSVATIGPPSSCLVRDKELCTSRSVSSSSSQDSRSSLSSIIRTIVSTELDRSREMHGRSFRCSSTVPAIHTREETAPRQGTVSEKLAFFEAKKSPEFPRPKSAMANRTASSLGNSKMIPDLIDELRELGPRSGSRMAMSYMCSASSEDILRTLTTNKHQRSLSLLDGPAPDVVPAQTPPYYYSDLSLSKQCTIPLDHRLAKPNKQVTNTFNQQIEDPARQTEQSKMENSRSLLELNSQELVAPMQQIYEATNIRKDKPIVVPNNPTSKAQSVSCENLIKKQLPQKVLEVTQSATCLLESEPFYENIGFGCKSSAAHGPEPQSSPAKVSFLAVNSTGVRKTVSVDEPKSSHLVLNSSDEAKINFDRQSSSRGLTQEPARPNGKQVPQTTNERSENSDASSFRDYREPLKHLGRPDVIQSVLNSSSDTLEHDNEIFEQIINSISCPSKIDIPERYVSESDSDSGEFSVVERLARYNKVNTIRRRLAGHSRDHASRLTMNQVIAKQAKHVSKIVAAHN